MIYILSRRVILGEHDIEDDPDCENCPKKIVREITEPEKQITVHKGWLKGTAKDDIALIRFNEPIQLFDEDSTKSSISPICLPWDEDSSARYLFDGDVALVTGWGKTQTYLDYQNDRIEGSTKLLKVKAKIADENCNNLIEEHLGNLDIDSKIQVCAGGVKGKDSCNGDSGGPLVFREFSDDPWIQVGLVSFGSPDCGAGVPAVYTRIEGYLDWIESNMKP